MEALKDIQERWEKNLDEVVSFLNFGAEADEDTVTEMLKDMTLMSQREECSITEDNIEETRRRIEAVQLKEESVESLQFWVTLLKQKVEVTTSGVNSVYPNNSTLMNN